MTPAQMEAFRTAKQVRPGHEWDKFEGLALPAERVAESSSPPCPSRKARRAG